MCTSSDLGLPVFHFRGIHVDYKRCLVGIDHTKKEATFKKMDSDTGETEKCQVYVYIYHMKSWLGVK